MGEDDAPMFADNVQPAAAVSFASSPADVPPSPPVDQMVSPPLAEGHYLDVQQRPVAKSMGKKLGN